MRVKGKDYTADYLDYNTAFDVALKLMKKYKRIGLLIMFGINTGLRYSDLSRLHDKDIAAAKENNNELVIYEQKTNKKRILKLNAYLLESYEAFPKIGYLFVSQKRSIFNRDHVNRELKKYFRTDKKRNVSTHSLRKTFARNFYDVSEDKQHALIKIATAFNHTETHVTRRYLGINKEEQEELYTHVEQLNKKLWS